MMWTCMLPNITDGGRADRHNPLQSVSLSKVAGRISFCRGLLYGRLGWPDVLQGSTCPSIKVQIIVFVTDSIISYFVGFAAAASNANRHALMPPGTVAGGVAPEDTSMQVTLRGATIIIHCLYFFSIPSSHSLRLLLMRTVIP